MQSEVLRIISTTAIFIASKYEEIYPPLLKDIVHTTKIIKKDILYQEGLILQVLEFNLTMPSPIDFLEAYFIADPTLDNYQRALTNYLLHLSLHDTKHITILPSKLVAASILVAKKLQDLQNHQVWTSELEVATGYTQP